MANNIKKIITFVMALILMLSCMMLPVHAEEYKIEDFLTEGKIKLSGTPVITASGDDTGSQIEIFYSTPEAMIKLGEHYGPAFDTMFGTDGMCLMGVQFDYKVNSGNWHYNTAWDTLNQSNMENSVVTYWNNMNDIRGPETNYRVALISTYNETEDYGDISALVKTNGEDAYLDLENNTIKFRMRAYIYYKMQDGSEHYVFSDWTQEQAPGETLSTEEKHEFIAPTISYVEVKPVGNDETNITIKVDINEEILNELSELKSIYGTNEEFLLEGKLIPVDKDGNLLNESAEDLVNLFPENTMFGELGYAGTLEYNLVYNGNIERYDRCAITVRFVARDQFESAYSEPKLVSILAVEDPNQDEEGNLIIDDPVVEEVCPLCGFCSRPLNMCIFTIGIIVVIVLVVVTLAAFFIRKKKNEMY